MGLRTRAISVAGSGLMLTGLLVAVVPAPAVAAVQPAWTLDTLAGSGPGGWGGFSGDGGPAVQAEMNFPTGAGVGPDGSVYIADDFNNRIRKVNPAGIMSTVAGTGESGYNGDGIPATQAMINSPTGGVGFDAAGNIFFGDTGNGRVRRIDHNGIVTTVAGDGTLYTYGGDGGPATSAQLNGPQSPTFDAAGNMYFADWGSQRIRKVDTNGTITTVAGGGSPADGLGDGGLATDAALSNINDVYAMPDGTLYIADTFNNRVRKVDTAGIITTVAGNGSFAYTGDGGPATDAALKAPVGVTVQGSGNIFIADYHNSVVRRVDVNGTIDTVLGTGEPIYGTDGSYGPLSTIGRPQELDFDRDGNLLVSIPDENRVRRLGTSYLWIDSRPDPLRQGDAFTYRMTVSGLPKTATGVTLATTLPNQVTFGSVNTSQGSCTQAQAKISCTLGTVTPGTEVTVSIGVTARKAGQVPITATIGASNLGDIPAAHTMTAYTRIADASCGMVVTKSTVLKDSIGPCSGDGIRIAADNITLDLGGNKVFGFDGPGDGTQGGIKLVNRTGVTVRNGTVTGFDGGIMLKGGASNTVTGMTVRDNVGPTNVFNALLGDGIILFDSPGNTISNNTVSGNGNFDGIGVFGPGADNNRILGNKVTGSHGQGIIVNGANDAGEAVFITGSLVSGNTSSNNDNAGISNINNTFGTVENNIVRNNGFNGIAVQAGVRAGDVDTELTVQNNQVSGNIVDGIQVARRTHGAKILNNTSTDNGRNYGGAYAGLYLFDLSDKTPDCSDNVWSGNKWGSALYNPPCTSAGGTGPAPPAPAAAVSSSEEAPKAANEPASHARALPPGLAKLADKPAPERGGRRAP